MAHLSDRVADTLVRRQVQTLRAAEGVSAAVVTDLRAAEARITKVLVSKDLTRYAAARLKNTLGEIREVLADFAQTAYKTVRREIPEIAALVAARTAGDLNDLFNVDVFDNHFDARKALASFDQEVVAGQTMKKYWSKQTSEMTRAYGSIVKESVLAGETPAELLKRVKNDPRIAAKPGQIRTMVRSTTMQTANTARMSMYEENEDLIKGIQWLSTLDSRTSPICQGLDGLTWSMKKVPIGHDKRYPGPTAHPNCRSTQLPLLRSFAELAGRNQDLASQLDDAMSRRTRASMDGQVSASLSYGDWLRTKGDDFALSVLGARRFDMWKGGTLELRDMLDQRGNPLLAAELREEFLNSLPVPSISPPDIEQSLKAQYEEMTENAYFNYRDGEDEEVRMLFRDYTEDASAYNKMLRNGSWVNDAETVDMVEHFNSSAVQMLDKNTLLYRGMFTKDPLPWKVGDVISDSGFLSTSRSRTQASQFAQDADNNKPGTATMLRIKTPSGTRIVTGDIEEDEFILAPNTRLRVLSRTEEQWGQNSRIQVIDVEVISIDDIVTEVPLSKATAILESAEASYTVTAAEMRNGKEAFQNNRLGNLGILDKELANSLEAYTEDVYVDINNFLRNPNSPMRTRFNPSDVLEMTAGIRKIFSLLKPVKKEVTLWRAVSSQLKALFEGKIGDVYTAQGFVSTSYTPKDLMFSSNSVMMQIKVPKNTTRMVTGSVSEFELLLDHGTQFKITGRRVVTHFKGVRLKPPVTIIEVEVVPSDQVPIPQYRPKG